MSNFILKVVFPLLLLSGCNASVNSKLDDEKAIPDIKVESASNASNDNKAPDYKGLSSSYLLGDWCYTHYQYTDPSTKIVDRSDESINFIFANDGTYITQNNSGTPMKINGKYEFLPNGVFKFYIGSYTVVSVDPDIFVLHKQVDHYFSRGVCK